MTKKDYQLIAEAIRVARNAGTPSSLAEARGFQQGIDAVVNFLAADLVVDNPRFNPSTFRKAAG